MPAYAPFSATYSASGFAGQLFVQSALLAVSVRTVTSERRSLMRCTLKVPREVGTLRLLYPSGLYTAPLCGGALPSGFSTVTSQNAVILDHVAPLSRAK